MQSQQNIYGLSEGVFKACQFLGLKFPPITSDETLKEHLPSDYFGDNFELDSMTKKRLCAQKKLTDDKFDKIYSSFSKRFSSQKSLRQSRTDLNIFFCDYLLFVRSGDTFVSEDYFHFEFYKKSFELRKTFMWINYETFRRVLCNDHYFINLLSNKPKTCKLFAEFLHRDWLDTHNCTFEEFKSFVGKHPRFFSKPIAGTKGKGSKIISVDSNENLEKVFSDLKSRKCLVEELINQHESLQAFCPDVVNTIRVCTFLDIHNVVHILTTSGRFGRMGNIVDNFHGGGYAVIIDPKTGIIISDAINGVHERVKKHQDSGKTFKGFQYPAWEKVRATVIEMAKIIPQLRHIGWDIAINNKGDAILVEANGSPGIRVQQAPDSVGRLHIYQPLMEELRNYKREQMRLIGYRVNTLRDFDSAYNNPSRKESRLQYAMIKLVPDCASLIDLGCRNSKFVQSICPANVKYFPVDFKKHFDEVIACDFNAGNFPDIKADTILCALTAEYVEPLPQFLANMCDAAQKQILMWCRPIDKEIHGEYRWKNPFLTDFTEDFLISTMAQNNFQLNAQFPAIDNRSIILYDFRKT